MYTENLRNSVVLAICVIGLIVRSVFYFNYQRKRLPLLNDFLIFHTIKPKNPPTQHTKKRFWAFLKQKISISSLDLRLNLFIIVAILIFGLFLNMIGNHHHQYSFFLSTYGLILSSFLLLHRSWPTKFKSLMPYLWHFNLAYCLPFLVITNLIFAYGNIKEWAIIFSFITLGVFTLLLVVVEWELVLFMNIIGGLGALMYCQFTISPNYCSLVLAPAISHAAILFLKQMIIFGIEVILFSAWVEYKSDVFANYIDNSSLSKKENIFLNQEFFNLHTRNLKQGAHNEAFALEICDQILSLPFSEAKAINIKLELLKEYVIQLNQFVVPYILDAKFYSATDLIKEIKNGISVVETSGITFEFSSLNEAKIRLDISVIKQALRRFIQNLCDKLSGIKTGDSIKIFISFKYTTINYVRERLNANNLLGEKSRQEPALSIIVSEYSKSKNNVLKTTYTKSLVATEDTPNNDVIFQNIINGIEAHYGLIEISEDKLIWNCVVPLDVYRVRPVVMDLAEPIANFYNYPQAEDLERKFLGELQNSSLQCSFYKVYRAIDVIKQYHSHQTRKSGEPYYMHPLYVGDFLLKLIKIEHSETVKILEKNLETLILGALLHDILEDTVYTNKAILSNFGHPVNNVVLEVTKIDMQTRAMLLTNEEAFNALIKKDPISLSIKLLDRYHNLSTIAGHSSIRKRHAVAQETLIFFIEPAERYGFNILAELLKKMSETILKTDSLKPEEFIY